MAALDMNNYTHSASSYGGYSRTDINNFIRNCYATNDPTNNINRIMTIEEDDEDEEETAVFGESNVSPSVYLEKRHKRIEDWNKVYNSDDENNAGVASSDGGSVDDDKVGGAGDGNEGDNNTTDVEEKSKEADSPKPINHKFLKVTFADDFGCDLIQNFIIRNTTDDDEEENDDIEATADKSNDNSLSNDKSDDDQDNDNEKSPHSPIKGTRFESKFSFGENIGFEYLERTINRLFSNDIDLCGGYVDIGGDMDLCGGDVDIGGDTDCGRNIDNEGDKNEVNIGGNSNVIKIDGSCDDIDIGGTFSDNNISCSSGEDTDIKNVCVDFGNIVFPYKKDVGDGVVCNKANDGDDNVNGGDIVKDIC